MNLTDSAIKYEVGQRSFAMVARLFLRLALIGIGIWAASTFALVWYWTARYCGPFAHRYFGEWLLAWFFSDELPVPFISLPYHGQRYAVQTMYAFLNGRIYFNSFGVWFERYELWGLVPPLILAGMVLLFLAGNSAYRDGSDAEHLRGLKRVPAGRLNRRLRGDGIKIAGVRICRTLEPEHFLITGATGSGKSLVLRDMLRQIEQRGETAVVVDPECEFAAEFYRAERGDVLMNPLDARCPRWSPWDEVDPESNEVDAEMLAAAFVPDPPGPHGEDGAAYFFRQSSRTLITSMLKIADPKDPASLLKLLNLSRSELKRQLTGTPAEALIDPGAHDQGAGIVATAANAINPLRYLPKKAERSWSAREWSTGHRSWVFLTSRDDMATAVMPLLSVWLDCIVRRLLARQAEEKTLKRVWIVVDELAALARQAQLENLLVRGRKRELSAVIGFQTISQLRAIYGREQASVVASMPSTKLLLRVDEPETALFLSRQIGEREVSRELLGANADEFRTGISLHTSRNVESLVLPSEIQGLPKLEGYLCIAGCDRARVKVPLCIPRPRRPGFVARRNVLDSATSKNQVSVAGNDQKMSSAIASKFREQS